MKISLRGLPSGPGVEHETVTSWSGLALSPDGKKIALTGHGEVFAASASGGGETQRLTHTDAQEMDPRWEADSNKVVYRSERGGGSNLYEYDFGTNAERALTQGAALDTSALPSPDGKRVAFIRNRRELHVLTLAGGADKVVATGEINEYQANSMAWSPDSRWVAYVPTGTAGFTNVWAVPADGSAPTRELTFLANGQNASNLAWSPDGKYILFDTAQRAETAQLARVDLMPHVPVFREDQFRDLFRKQSTPGAPDTPGNAGGAARDSGPDRRRRGMLLGSRRCCRRAADPLPPMRPGSDARRPAGAGRGEGCGADPKIVFEEIRQRLTLLPLGGLGVRYPVISPDGKTLAFLAEIGGQQNIYTYSLEEGAREPATPRQLTSDPGAKSDVAWSPDSKALFYLQASVRGGAPAAPGAGSSGVRMVTLATRTPDAGAADGGRGRGLSRRKRWWSSMRPGRRWIIASSGATSTGGTGLR